MGKAIPVKILDQSFATSAAFREYVKLQLEHTGQGEVIQEPLHAFLLELVRRHPEAADKFGMGINHFKVLANTNYGGKTYCFYAFRLDGTHTDFSYQKCIPTMSRWEEFQDATRAAVMDGLIAERDRAFGGQEEILCPIKKIPMTKSVSHIDHVAPDTFGALLERFMDEEWLHPEDPPATVGGGSSCSRKLVDRGVEERWRYFHQTSARLRVISKEAASEARGR